MSKRHKHSAQAKSRADWGSFITIVLIVIVLLVVQGIISTCQSTNRAAHLAAGDWQAFTLYVCAQKQQGLDRDWDVVASWVKTAEISVTSSVKSSDSCVSVETTFAKEATKKGDFHTVTISWEISSGYSRTSGSTTKACPTVFLDDRPEEKWSSFPACTWELFPYNYGKDIRKIFSITKPKEAIFPKKAIFR